MKDLEFEVKEKVLCYEPDKDKEKILYDATIVEIRKKSDSPGFQYMIHFKEWSKSFDRWVDKNLLLKVTPENKKIQRDLFIKIIKENGDRALKHVPGMRKIKKELEAEEKMRNSSNGNLRSSRKRAPSTSQSEMSSNDDTPEEEFDNTGIPEIALSDRLIYLLENDHIKVEKKRRLLKLPASMNVVQILENYVRHYAANLENTPHVVADHRSDTHLIDRDQYHLELVMEIVDDMRILFDHVLESLLLYSAEKSQCKRLMENATIGNNSSQNQSPEPPKSEEKVFQQPSSSQKKRPRTADAKGDDNEAQTVEYTKKWLIRGEDLGKTGIIKDDDGTRRSSRNYTVLQSKGTRGIPTPQKATKAQAEKEEKPKKEAEKRVTRRQQLSTDCCIDLNPKIFVRRTSITTGNKKKGLDSSKAGTPDTIKSDQSDRANDLDSPLNMIEHLSPNQFSDANEIRKTMSLSNIWKWRMLPIGYKPPVVPPSLIYGAQHLLRLFVVIPDLLRKMRLKRNRRELLTDVLNGLINFLEAYDQDLFQEVAYELVAIDQ